MAEHSCFTCDHARDDMGAPDPTCCRAIILVEDIDAAIIDYITAAYREGRAVDRTIACPRWARRVDAMAEAIADHERETWARRVGLELDVE